MTSSLPETTSRPTQAPPRARAVAPLPRGSYWQLRAGTTPAPVSSAEPPRDAEIVIIGAGLAGLATACAIKAMRPSTDVAVLEAHHVGYGASGRNGGLVAPIAAPFWLLTARRNADHAWALTHLNRAGTELARALAERMPEADVTRETLQLESGGTITGAGLADIARTLDRLDIQAEVDPSGRRGTLTLDTPAHGLDPFALVRGLANEARQAGVSIHEGVRVAGIEDTGTGARLTLGSGRGIAARRVVVATNAYTRDLALPQQPAAHTVFNYMLATAELPDDELERLGREGVFTVEINRAYVFYRLHRKRLVFGGIDKLRHKVHDLDVPPRVMGKLQRLLTASFETPPAPLTHAWAGRYHATRTELPVIGPAAGLASTVLNVGYGGTGVVLTQVLAPVAAAMALRIPCPDANAARLHAVMDATRLPVTAGIAFGSRVAWAVAKQIARGGWTRRQA